MTTLGHRRVGTPPVTACDVYASFDNIRLFYSDIYPFQDDFMPSFGNISLFYSDICSFPADFRPSFDNIRFFY